MDQEKIDYLKPSYPVIIVKKLTKERIEKAAKAYGEERDGDWLNFYHFSSDIDKNVFAKLKVDHIKELKEFDKFTHFEIGRSPGIHLKGLSKDLRPLESVFPWISCDYWKPFD